MSKKELEVAVLFQRCYEDDDVCILMPTRLLIGVQDEINYRFYDILSQDFYYSTDRFLYDDEAIEGFAFSRSLNHLKKMYCGLDTAYACFNYLNDVRKKVYFFDLNEETYDLEGLPIEEFNQQFDMEFKYLDTPQTLDSIDFDKLEKTKKDLLEIEIDEEEQKVVAQPLPPIDELYNQITKNVLCQDEAVKSVLTAIYRHKQFDHPKFKANILLYGPTGVGKTEILRQISKKLNLPMVVEDANSYTVAGYKGKDVEDALRNLYIKADGNLELAQHGILVFDEIDKKNKRGNESSGVSSDGFLNALLKIIEGDVYQVDLSGKGLSKETISFDTSKLIVIVSGAFQDMLKKKNKPTVSLGFASNAEAENKHNEDIVDKFVEYGMPPEFMGRFNDFIEMNSLSKDDLKKILLYSESSLLMLYKEKFEKIGIDIKITDEFIDKVCTLAYKRGTGVRALNFIINDIFNKWLYHSFSNSGQDNKEIVLDETTFESTQSKRLVLKKTVQND